MYESGAPKPRERRVLNRERGDKLCPMLSKGVIIVAKVLAGVGGGG